MTKMAPGRTKISLVVCLEMRRIRDRTTGLEDTEQGSADCEGYPAVYETHAENDGSPRDDQEAHPESGTDFADDEVGWQLEDGVTDEEHQQSQGISGTNVKP